LTTLPGLRARANAPRDFLKWIYIMMNIETPIPAKSRPIFTLKLRPEPGIDPIRALRHALKRLLRSYGLRCVSVEQDTPTC
jgi:hypothetical protein